MGDFLFSLELYYAAVGLNGDAQRITFAATLLRDHALPCLGENPDIWDALKGALTTYFQPRKWRNLHGTS